MPAPLRCLLVDDEPLAHTVLRAYLDRLPGLAAWAGSCYGAVEALTFLRTSTVDVLFLDVDMPQLTGLELLRALPQLPAAQFMRTHKSYLVNLASVERLSGNVLLVGPREVPVGSTYRQEVLRQLHLR